MSYTSYHEMDSALRARSVFRGNSVHSDRQNNRYLVYSYRTLMYSAPLQGDDFVYFDFSQHSVTTSKIQSKLYGLINWEPFVYDEASPIKRQRKYLDYPRYLKIPREEYIIDPSRNLCRLRSDTECQINNSSGKITGNIIKCYSSKEFEF